jgi:hypothetical protein
MPSSRLASNFIITATEGQLTGNVLQHCCVRGSNHCSDIVIGSLLPICPEPKSAEQICCLRYRIVNVFQSPDRTWALMSSSACAVSSRRVATTQQCGIEMVELSPRLRHQVASDRLVGMTIDVHRSGIRPARKGHGCSVGPAW